MTSMDFQEMLPHSICIVLPKTDDFRSASRTCSGPAAMSHKGNKQQAPQEPFRTDKMLGPVAAALITAESCSIPS
ncbi:hypothetical protein PMN64_03660 [Bradyrhizobium sp. UFLA01-814]|uniref:hypothetical protein n=1 Tax=Bradyrhizobium sp. UFLA01-814 TaxID=3023480 RepID=UPI00398A57B0